MTAVWFTYVGSHLQRGIVMNRSRMWQELLWKVLLDYRLGFFFDAVFVCIEMDL